MNELIVDKVAALILTSFENYGDELKLSAYDFKNNIIPKIVEKYSCTCEEARWWVQRALKQLCDKKYITKNGMFIVLMPEGINARNRNSWEDSI